MCQHRILSKQSFCLLSQFNATRLTFNSRCLRELARHMRARVGQVLTPQHVVLIARAVVLVVSVVVRCPMAINHKLVKNFLVRDWKLNSLLKVRTIVVQSYGLLPVVEGAGDEDFLRGMIPATLS